MYTHTHTHIWFVQKVSSHVIWKIETLIGDDTRYKNRCTQDNDASVPFTVGTLGPHTVLSIAISCPIIFSWISLTVWNVFPFRGDFCFGKSRNHRAQILGCRGAELLGWFDVLSKNSAWDVMHEWAHCHNEATNHQLPTAAAFWVIQIVSVEECSNLTQNLMQIHRSSYSVVCNGHTVHMLTQQCLQPPLTSTVKSSLFTHAHASPLSLAARLHRCHANCSHYINIGWTFPDRPHICTKYNSEWS